jgi:hypothetical protein
MKTLMSVIALTVLLTSPSYAQPGRKVSSVIGFSGATAKMVFEGLPGAPDTLSDGVSGKEGDLICYRKAGSFHCSVRGEDEETGSVDGAPAKQIFEKLSPSGEYEDAALGLARESTVNCLEKKAKTPFSYSCTLN